MTDHSTQTTPKGMEIPVPAKADVLAALRKAAKVAEPVSDDHEKPE